MDTVYLNSFHACLERMKQLKEDDSEGVHFAPEVSVTRTRGRSSIQEGLLSILLEYLTDLAFLPLERVSGAM